ncbi:hypothetical protein BDZ97DRAFT_1761869 [Flammula alnicola]|nr:hypothetical protein BDZ97DRAFT_1761869 [Flammula alnicola]
MLDNDDGVLHQACNHLALRLSSQGNTSPHQPSFHARMPISDGVPKSSWVQGKETCARWQRRGAEDCSVEDTLQIVVMESRGGRTVHRRCCIGYLFSGDSMFQWQALLPSIKHEITTPKEHVAPSFCAFVVWDVPVLYRSIHDGMTPIQPTDEDDAESAAHELGETQTERSFEDGGEGGVDGFRTTSTRQDMRTGKTTKRMHCSRVWDPL